MHAISTIVVTTDHDQTNHWATLILASNPNTLYAAHTHNTAPITNILPYITPIITAIRDLVRPKILIIATLDLTIVVIVIVAVAIITSDSITVTIKIKLTY
jgi:hypothetical protein